MEVKINREIRNYTENIFFGLSLRQFVFSVLSCIIAIIMYFIFKPILGTEITSWICIICILPFVLMGFVKYNGMPMEELFISWIRFELLVPKNLVFQSDNIYYQMIISSNEKKGDKSQ